MILTRTPNPNPNYNQVCGYVMLGPLSDRLWAGGSDDPGATLAPYPFAIPNRNPANPP